MLELAKNAPSMRGKPVRVCVREKFEEIETPLYYIDNGVATELPGPTWLLKVWTYYYSDGTSEQVISRRVVS